MNNKILTKRIGKINPGSIDDYIKYNGYKALKKAISMSEEEVIKEVKDAKLRDRGGAAFPTGIKMEVVYREKMMLNMQSAMQMKANQGILKTNI